jgi:hypothetical protein
MADENSGLPNTIVQCDGCEKPLNVLKPFLSVVVKAQRQVLVTTVAQAEGDNFEEVENPEAEAPDVYLGTRSGRGRILSLHDFSCLNRYARDDKRKDAPAKIMQHHEPGEIYVPADNRSPEELVEAGDLPEAMLAVYAEQADAIEPGEGE